MDSTAARREIAEQMLRISTAWIIEYAERHRHVIALADRYNVGVDRIAEITELPVAEVRRILAATLRL